MSKKISIVLFRQDLRLSDNSAISSGLKVGDVLPIYILDNIYKIGDASKIWLHHSLEKLDKSLHGNLNIYMGNSTKIIQNLIDQYDVSNVFCNKSYEPWNIEQERCVEDICKDRSVNYEVFNSNYLWRPDEILKQDNSYYKVFTAYKNKSYTINPRKTITNVPKNNFIRDAKNKTYLPDLKLIPKRQDWYKNILNSCDIGELSAGKKIDNFIKQKLPDYKNGRDYPIKNQTSMLSPHLHFGEISPSQIWESVSSFAPLYADDYDIDHFLSEVIWREFSCYLLYHFKELHNNNFNNKFDDFPWEDNPVHLKCWQTGNTGYPIVDAGMRELWQTGYMHNRVRMITASFLVKNLNIHWHKGMDWFWNCLVDADLANNSASWQWVAGCGADAAPYFRIFNPVLQGEKFDKTGDYTRRFVPELSNLPDKYLFKPWDAPEHVLKSASIELGKTYPKPIIDLKISRDRALESYKNLSK